MTQIDDAALALQRGQLVAFPTETVYGLGADAANPTAVARIYEAKQRPTNHPLIIHVSSVDQMDYWAIDIPEYARLLAKAFWPGPMTLILQRSDAAKDFVTGGQPSVGLRVPNHPVALELLRKFESLGGKGVAAPSANLFGRVSPTTTDAVSAELSSRLSGKDMVLEGGSSAVGIESTIIDCTKAAPSILRPGAITEEMISDVTNLSLIQRDSDIRVSGALDSHYAPRAKVFLNIEPKPGQGLIALASEPTPVGVFRLCSPEDVNEYAQQLYSALRLADEKEISEVVAITPSGDGIAIAIRDRLSKASFGN
jgi:L-threonylcarbamoyladenylate synthase